MSDNVVRADTVLYFDKIQIVQDLRDGDRLFYTNPGQFTPSQLTAIKEFSLSSLLCAIADKPEDLWLTRNVFARIDRIANRFVHCQNLPKLNLQPWSSP